MAGLFLLKTHIPGYAQHTVEYIDPYSGEPDSYMVNQDIKRKKHPIGSEYKLLYSRKERKEFEKSQIKYTGRWRYVFSDWL